MVKESLSIKKSRHQREDWQRLSGQYTPSFQGLQISLIRIHTKLNTTLLLASDITSSLQLVGYIRYAADICTVITSRLNTGRNHTREATRILHAGVAITDHDRSSAG